MASEMLNNPQRYGEKIQYNPQWKGPMQLARHPTDRIWLFVFLFYICIYITAAMCGFLMGDLNKIRSPRDSADRICGVDSEVANKPFLLYFYLKDFLNITGVNKSPSACVSECPTNNFIYDSHSNYQSLHTIKANLFCITDINTHSFSSFDQLDILIRHKKCTKWYLKSEPAFGLCIPLNVWKEHITETVTKEELDLIKHKMKGVEYALNKIYFDVGAAIIPAITAIIFGGIIALLYTVLLKWLAIPLFYASLFMICTSLAFGIYRLSIVYSLNHKAETLFSLTLLVLSITCVILMVIYFRKNIYLACQIIKESSKAVIRLPVTLIFPIIPWMLYTIVIIFSMLLLVSLLTVTEPHYQIEKLDNGDADGCKCLYYNESIFMNDKSCDPVTFNKNCIANGKPCQFLQCRLSSKTSPSYVYLLHSINLVGLLWILSFISGFEHLVLSGSFATWYWTFNKKEVSNFTLIQSLLRCIRYHLGTLALGSLILTISQIIRIALRILSQKLQESNNAVVQGFVYCFRCLYDVLDSSLNFLNYNAYIMCAIHGKNFYQSAKNAFNLLMRNIINIVFINTVADWIFWMAKLFVMSITVGSIMLYYDYNKTMADEEKYLSIFITAIGSYLIASVFFSVQGLAVNTIFLCFIEDIERNDGSDARPYYVDDKLKQLLQK